jgi:hypothetical protein
MKTKFSRTLYVLLVVVAFECFPASRTTENPLPGSDLITIENLQRHVEYWASPGLEGRKAGTAGYRKAADYAAGLLEKAGLQPGWRDADGNPTYLQPVPFVRFWLGSYNCMSIRRGGRVIDLAPDQNSFQIFNPGSGVMRLPEDRPVFVGFGVHEPELGWDDFKGTDLCGKIVLMMARFPTRPAPGLMIPDGVFNKYSGTAEGDLRRFSAVYERHPAVVIVVPDTFMVENWRALLAQRKQFNFSSVEPYERWTRGDLDIPVLAGHRSLIEKIFDLKAFDPIALSGNYQPGILADVQISLSLEPHKEYFPCYNVIGTVPGTDPALKGEHITVGAHLDHLGTDGGTVYPGANDDASGCAAVIEAARAVAANPLPRPVDFVLYTAKEANHIGSMHFLKHPPVGLEKVALNINVEQVGSRNRDIRGIGAVGNKHLEAALAAAARRAGGPEVRFADIESRLEDIQESDTLSFYLSGTPAVILGSGGFPERHTPQDTAGLTDYEHLRNVTVLLLAYIRELGNQSEPLICRR